MNSCMINKVSHDELNFEGLKITNNSSYSSTVTSSRSMANKAPSSTLSSIIFDKQKGVKRKLDFDADFSSDEDSTLRRENGKRRCLGDFGIRNPSFIDSDSNPVSPSKNRRSVASYSRSSISSSCRRRLFPYDKKIKDGGLESPRHLTKVNSKQNEVKLSLKKKFPGVPNSDSARSGLLLNLAFSKYNLPNAASSGKKSNVSYDFVDHTSVNTTTKKECIHYTSIEKDNSSFSKSPVFTAIKKVKRRLNLEDQESCISSNETSQFAGREKSSSKNSDRSKLTSGVSTSTEYVARKTERDGGLFVDSTNMIQNSFRTFPTNIKKPPSNNDLFKNSRLRASLKNKIFDLSTFTADGSNSTADVDVTDRSCTEVDSGNTWRAIHLSFDEGSSSARSACDQKRKPKYDRIVIRQDLVQRAKRDAERLKRLSAPSTESLNVQKFSRRTSAGRSSRENSHDNDSKTVCCKSKPQSSFIDSHLERFLKDCSEMAKLKLVSDENGSTSAESEEMRLSCEFDSQHSTNCNALDGNEEVESITNNAQCRNSSYPEIEDTDDSQEAEQPKNKTEFTIENIFSQEYNCQSTHIFDDSLNDDNLGETGQKADISFVSSSEEMNAQKLNHKVEEVLTQESELADIGSSNFLRSDGRMQTTQENTEDSAVKKFTLKKRGLDTLCGRLQTLVNREKSEARIWEYELSKKEVINSVNTSLNPNRPVMFSVEKMWKEFSRLVVLCARVDSDPSDEFFKNNLKDIGTNISHSVVIIIEPELFPKCITHSSIFRIHPPWRILYSAALNLQVIFRPTKVEIISPNGKPLSYSDPTLPLHPRTVEKNYFCYCNNVCDCVLPNKYETVIPCLLSLLSNSNGVTNLKSCTQDDVRTVAGIDNLIAMYRLLHAKLHLEFQVLSIDSDFNRAVFWHIIGLNDLDEVCCVLVKDEAENLPSIKTQMKVRFTGLIPWKTTPPRHIAAFVNQLNLKEVDLVSKLDTNDLHIFVLSARYGKIDLV